MQNTVPRSATSVAGVCDPGRQRCARRQSPGSQTPATAARGGFTLLECLVAAALLVVVMGLAAQLFIWDANERREVWRRQVAQQEAANALERLAMIPYEAINAEELSRFQLSKEAQGWLPDGKLTMTTSDVNSPAPGRRVEVQVRWGVRETGGPAPVRLVGWRFAPGSQP